MGRILSRPLCTGSGCVTPPPPVYDSTPTHGNRRERGRERETSAQRRARYLMLEAKEGNTGTEFFGQDRSAQSIVQNRQREWDNACLGLEGVSAHPSREGTPTGSPQMGGTKTISATALKQREREKPRAPRRQDILSSVSTGLFHQPGPHYMPQQRCLPARPAQPHRQDGYLIKLGHWSGKWQRRYFELVPSTLRLVYSKAAGTKAKGHIQLGPSSRVEPVTPFSRVHPSALGMGMAPTAYVENHSFLVSDSVTHRIYYLTCPTNLQLQVWLESINLALGRPSSYLSGSQRQSRASSPARERERLRRASSDGRLSHSSAATLASGAVAGYNHRLAPLPPFPGRPSAPLLPLAPMPNSVTDPDDDEEISAHFHMNDAAIASLSLTLPRGICGFLVTHIDPEDPGLSEELGLVPYDIIVSLEGMRMVPGVHTSDIRAVQADATRRKGGFGLRVYSCITGDIRTAVARTSDTGMTFGVCSHFVPDGPDVSIEDYMVRGQQEREREREGGMFM
ncbi:hypothetical protein KIPB_008074 [Kipferlia bialata]|uniref:PH domain-containing protein n=1 Tax=Kipferlia bialata TaxID=797122 RepID=A0A9K3D1D3_9EUKA|nr:hypothetical protein KIPB_008074 [Kipferlia bialata]|eukprot:g8074.t1